MKQFILFLILIFISLSQGNRSSDSLALVEIYNSADGNNWFNRSNWLSAEPIESWYGIITDGDRIISLSLRNNNLSGQIPEQVSDLTVLEFFDVSINNLTGAFPNIYNLVQLYWINVRSNQMDGPISENLANLVNLERIYAYNNSFSSFPDISGLQNLIVVRIDNNHFVFDDILPLIGSAFSYRYAPQKKTEHEIDTIAVIGSTMPLTGQFSGFDLNYSWFKNDALIANANSQSYILDVQSSLDGGIYRYEVTHDNIPDLTLVRNDIRVTATFENLPDPILGINLSSGDLSLTVSWDKSNDPDFSEYIIYASNHPFADNPVQTISDVNTDSYTLEALDPKDDWYIRITQKNTSNQESNFSLEVSDKALFNGAKIGTEFNVSLTDHKSFAGQYYNDIWGFKENNEDYVMISRDYGFEVYRINDSGGAELILVENGPNNDNSGWGELRYYNGYIYKSTESDSVRIFSINLNDSTTTYINRFHGDAHNIFLYNDQIIACGGSSFAPNMKSYSLADPENPEFMWEYTDFYVHDLSVQNDTMYLAELYNSNFALYDISNVTGQVLTNDYLIMRHNYPNGFTHNVYPSLDGKLVVTTDEQNRADHLKLWDISDPENVLNLFAHQEGDASIVHNAFIKNDFIYASYYTHGTVIFDISEPRLPIKVAQYDSYTPNDNASFNGNWGVYPFLDSDYVAMSNSDDGLDIIEFDQSQRAGQYTIELTDTSGSAFAEVFTVLVSDPKYVKYYTDNNIIVLKGSPNQSFDIDITAPSQNYSKRLSHVFNLNESVEKSLLVSNFERIETQVALFQNPVLSNYLNFSIRTDRSLSRLPAVSINEQMVTLNEMDSLNFTGSFKIEQTGSYAFNVVLTSTAAYLDTTRFFEITMLSKEKAAKVMSNDQSIVLNLQEKQLLTDGIALVERITNDHYSISPLELASAAKIEMKINSERYPDLEKVFVYQKKNNQWLALETQISEADGKAIAYSKELGEFKLAYNASYSGSNLIPTKFELQQNYPNPFNPSTTIAYNLPQDTHVSLVIYNALGQKIKTLINQVQRAGANKKVIWDGKNEHGQSVGSGIYFYQLRTTKQNQIKKMILIK